MPAIPFDLRDVNVRRTLVRAAKTLRGWLGPSSRLVRTVSLICYLWTASFWPIPIVADEAPSRHGHLCQGGLCGCGSSPRHNCCCTTMTPPVRRPAQQPAASAPRSASEHTQTSKVEPTISASCCSKTHSGAAPSSACHMPGSEADRTSKPDQPDQPDRHYVLGVFAAKCSGQEIGWMLAYWNTLPSVHFEWTLDTISSRLPGVISPQFSSPTIVPPDPPPRSV